MICRCRANLSEVRVYMAKVDRESFFDSASALPPQIMEIFKSDSA